MTVQSRVSPGFIAGRGLQRGRNLGSQRVRSRVSPGFIAGRGLKHRERRCVGGRHRVSPGFIAGRGLKHLHAFVQRYEHLRFARLHCRAWIETLYASIIAGYCAVSPGFIAGRGLKHCPLAAIFCWIDLFRPASLPGVD